MGQHRFGRALLGLALATSAVAPANAQQLGVMGAPTPEVQAAPAVAPAEVPSPHNPVVVQFNGQMHTQPWTQLNRPVTVALTGLHEWAAAGKNDPTDLRLFLAGRVIPKSEPSLISLSQGYLNFQLNLEPDDRTLWVQVLSEARSTVDHRIPISVGLKGGRQPFESDVYIALNVYPGYTPLVGALLALLLLGLGILGYLTPLLRDGSGDTPYSLGRVQMACWFYLVIAAYLYIWLITGEYNTLPTSILTLIGISGGTGLAAVFVERNRTQTADNERKTLETRQTALRNRIEEIAAANPAEESALQKELQQQKNSFADTVAKLANLPPVLTPAVSKNLLRDILSDGDGISFHRFQIVVWTIVLVFIFVRAAYHDLAMPDFDGSLLGLMGISSGTYLGFKFPEKPK